VLCVMKHVHSLASTKALASCSTLLLVVDYRVISAVPKKFPMVSSVQDFG
jgi:hypothetical protein